MVINLRRYTERGIFMLDSFYNNDFLEGSYNLSGVTENFPCIKKLEAQENNLNHIFQKNIGKHLTGPLMSGCSRDIKIDIYYEDKHGNKYGVDVEITSADKSDSDVPCDSDIKQDAVDGD